MGYEEYESTALVPLDDKALQSVMKLEKNMDMEQAMQFYHMQPLKNGKFKIVIDKAGLEYKAKEMYADKIDKDCQPVTGEKYFELKQQMGLKKDEYPCVIFECKVAIDKADGTKQRVNAYGSATTMNMKRRKSGGFANNFFLEQAETRAELRALKKITGCGFSAVPTPSEEDIDDTDDEAYIQEETEKSRKKMWALLEQIGVKKDDRKTRLDLYRRALGKPVSTSKGFTLNEYNRVNHFLDNLLQEKLTPPPGEIIDGDYTVDDDPPEKLSEEQLNQITNLYIEAKWDSEKQEKYFSYMREKNPGKFTATNERDFSPEEAEKFILLLKKKIVEADKKAMETPPAAPPPEEAPLLTPEEPKERHAHVPASYSQIAEADELFKQLEYDWQKKINFFADYRYRTGESYVKSVKDMDFIKAGLLIDHLKKELAEKHKMENGQFPGGVTEEENEEEKQGIKDNTIPTSEKMQGMFDDGEIPI